MAGRTSVYRFGVIAGVLLVSVLATACGTQYRSMSAGPSPRAAVDFIEVASAVMPAVVNISTTRIVRAPDAPPGMDDPAQQREFFGEDFPPGFHAPRARRVTSLGSGVIVSADGYIVTNNHVIAKAEEITVILNDEREFTAKVIGTDPPTDIAVIRIDATDLPVFQWGDSDALRVGEPVLAVGNPFALRSTVTSGIVSAVGRANIGIVDYEDFIQTDAAVNPGNSGGALVNTRGELVGINTAILSGTGGHVGVGFAVPANMARPVMNSLIKTGKVTRGWLGVAIQEVDRDIAEAFGLPDTQGTVVTEVVADSPAASVIRAGDVIRSFDGDPVASSTGLRNRVAQTPPGRTVEIELLRGDERRTVQVAVGEQPRQVARAAPGEAVPGEEPEPASPLAGLTVSPLTPDVASKLGVSPETEGVVITNVPPASAAAAAGVQPGDVIQEVNRKPVTSVDDLRRIDEELGDAETALLFVNRRGNQLFLVVRS